MRIRPESSPPLVPPGLRAKLTEGFVCMTGALAFAWWAWPRLAFDTVLPEQHLTLHAAPSAKFFAGMLMGWIGASLAGWLLAAWRHLRALRRSRREARVPPDAPLPHASLRPDKKV